MICCIGTVNKSLIRQVSFHFFFYPFCAIKDLEVQQMLSLSHSFYAVISFLFKSGMQVGAKMTSVRMVQVGGKYQMPPAAQGSPPSNFTGMLEWRSIVCATLEEKLIDSLVIASLNDLFSSLL
jgi:hypothetical protein